MKIVKPRQTLPNTSILDFANTYFEAGKLLYHQDLGNGFYLPAANLLCHSVELYLKSLSNPANSEATGTGIYIEKTSSKKGHRLSKMLKQVEENFNDQLTRKPDVLEEKLKQIEGLFQASRYPFEKDNQGFFANGQDKIAFEVAEFLNSEVNKLIIPVHEN